MAKSKCPSKTKADKPSQTQSKPDPVVAPPVGSIPFQGRFNLVERRTAFIRLMEEVHRPTISN